MKSRLLNLYLELSWWYARGAQKQRITESQVYWRKHLLMSESMLYWFFQISSSLKGDCTILVVVDKVSKEGEGISTEDLFSCVRKTQLSKIETTKENFEYLRKKWKAAFVYTEFSQSLNSKEKTVAVVLKVMLPLIWKKEWILFLSDSACVILYWIDSIRKTWNTELNISPKFSRPLSKFIFFMSFCGQYTLERD